MNCPICKNELEIKYRDYLDGITLLEEQMECNHCSYGYFFAYGNIQEWFLKKDYYSSYSNEYKLSFWDNLDYKIRIKAAKIIYKVKEKYNETRINASITN